MTEVLIHSIQLKLSIRSMHGAAILDLGAVLLIRVQESDSMGRFSLHFGLGTRKIPASQLKWYHHHHRYCGSSESRGFSRE